MLTLPMRFLPAPHMYTIVIIIIIVASSWHHHHRQPSPSPASSIIVASHHPIASSHRIGIAASHHPCREAKRQLNISSRASARISPRTAPGRGRGQRQSASPSGSVPASAAEHHAASLIRPTCLALLPLCHLPWSSLLTRSCQMT